MFFENNCRYWKKSIDFTKIKHWTNYKITNWMGQS